MFESINGLFLGGEGGGAVASETYELLLTWTQHSR